jgi:hypothetical protein
MALTLPSGFVVRPLPLPEGFDPLTANEQQLVNQGLPRRPKDPALLSDWEALVQSLARCTFIEPEFRSADQQVGPRPRAGAYLTEQWSGGIVFLPANPPAGAKLDIVTGRWTVPNCGPADGTPIQFHCSSWIGIDGWNSEDILQAGVTCVAQWANPGPGVWQTTFPWWEWWPGPPIQITNFAVDAGNLVSCIISTNSTTVANIVFSNISTNQYTAFEVTGPAGISVVGECAEWIVERPRDNGVITQLADYGSLAFQ